MAKKTITTSPEELRKQILEGLMGQKTHRAKNTNLVKNLRRQLAQVLTKRREGELHAHA